MDTKKEQERDELHRAIWAIADGLRCTVGISRTMYSALCFTDTFPKI